MKRTHSLPLLAALLLPLLISCSRTPPPEAPGVSLDLAQRRAQAVDSIRYTLHFSIPAERETPVSGTEQLRFFLRERTDLPIDFREGGDRLRSLRINGRERPVRYAGEHLHLDRRDLRQGWNEVEIGFLSGDASLNRRDDHLYTLLVPDRARTVFPCFDQPDLKALYTLSLDLPADWTAVANGSCREDAVRDGRKRMAFNTAGPVSTYLFSFAAGKWEKTVHRAADRTYTAYYRETDPAKTAQLDEIFGLIDGAVRWMEDYTGIPLPFEKYDFVIVPGFQFGGMEHPGAILFNDRRMFLDEHPTTAERYARAELITHETAHMWFGDAVTMRWFNDVWTKEVFANHFAALMSRDLLAEGVADPVEAAVRDFRNFNLNAYKEDRTAGSNPVRQELDNLASAGLVYGNIVYDKAPVVMRMLSGLLGPEAFRDGLREYLRTYFHGNADWNDLIGILDRHTGTDLKAWSRSWVDEKGMPAISARIEADTLVIRQEDPYGRGLVWPQRLRFGTGKEEIEVWTDRAEIKCPAPGTAYAWPDTRAEGYGRFSLDSAATAHAPALLKGDGDPRTKISVLTALYEAYLRGELPDARSFPALLEEVVRGEGSTDLSAAALAFLGDLSLHGPLALSPATEAPLLRIVRAAGLRMETRQTAFRHLLGTWQEEGTTRDILSAFLRGEAPYGLALGQKDFLTMAYELAVRVPDRYKEIGDLQRSRIDNADVRQEFDFIYRAVAPDRAGRDSVLQCLLDAENRRIEPQAQSALAYLNHPLRQEEALPYLRPALEELEEIQRTGDIFFPKNWAAALLRGHDSPEAADTVSTYLQAHPDLSPLLRGKVLQSAGHLISETNDND